MSGSTICDRSTGCNLPIKGTRDFDVKIYAKEELSGQKWLAKTVFANRVKKAASQDQRRIDHK